MSNDRAGRGVLAAILLISAGLRLAACAVWSDDLVLDPDGYGGLAERLIAGAGYVAPDGRPTAFRPPFYPFLLAGVIGAGPAGIATLQIVLGVATVALTAAAGRRFGLGEWSLFAAAIVAIDPLLVRYTSNVMTEATCAFLAALLLWLISERRRSMLTGFVFGLTVLARPTFWAFGLLMAAAWLWDRSQGERGASAPWSRPNANTLVRGLTPPARWAALALCGATLVVAPWAVRNAFMFGRPIVTTTHGGYTLLLANNPVFWREVIAGRPGSTWQGPSLDAWQQSLERRMVQDGVPQDDELARDRWMKEQAVANIREQPDLFLRSALYRLRRLWDVSPIGPAAQSLPAAVRWSVATFYFLVLVAAVAGVVRCLLAWRAALLLVAAFTAVHAVYWTDVRMRAPLVPAIALLAAHGMTGISSVRRARQDRVGT